MFGETKKSIERDENTALIAADISSQMATYHGRRRLLFIFGSIIATAWILVLIFPNFVANTLLFVGLEKITLIPFSILFAASMFFGYGIANYLVPDLEENKTLSSNVFESVKYQNASSRRTRLWIAAILFGLLNTGAMVFVSFLLFNYDLYLFEI